LLPLDKNDVGTLKKVLKKEKFIKKTKQCSFFKKNNKGGWTTISSLTWFLTFLNFI